MKLIRGLHNLSPAKKPSVTTIGNFDGFHRGHQAIIQQVIRQAKKHQATSTLISFTPSPIEYFSQCHGRTATGRIYPFRDKLNQALNTKIEQYLCLTFNHHFSQLEATDFVKNILVDQLKISHLIVGDDFCFGKGRQGNFELLQSLGKQYHFTVSNTQTLLEDGKRISSTRIRQLLEKGNIKEANQLLGHPYQLSGRIRHGDKRGRTIGFPTINIQLPNNIVTAKGVYAVMVSGLSDDLIKGVANLGTRPTVMGKEVRLEVHLFDFDQLVYGQYVTIELKQMIRPEKKFDNFQQLLVQIKQDAQQATELLA